ncbi:MAG: hypothetical protein ACJZ47_02785 [bacterium]
MNNSGSNKKRTTMWIDKDLLEWMDTQYKKEGCSSRTAFNHQVLHTYRNYDQLRTQ